MTRILGIAIRAGKRAPMQALEHASITPERGVANDFRGRPGKRQVTLLSLDDWQRACDAIERSLDWTTRRSNLLVEHMPWPALVGRRLKVGEAILEVCTEIDPCSRMDEAAQGLMEALVPDWRGGAGCRVIAGGAVRVGDAVTVLEP